MSPPPISTVTISAAVAGAPPPPTPERAARTPAPRPGLLLRRRLRNLVTEIDPLHLAASRLLRPEHALRPGTRLVIEGFPRSANSYLEGCARHAWGRDLAIAQHAHAAPPLRAAARRGLPAMLPLRAPRSAIASLLLRDPESFTPRLAAAEYVAFHRGVLPALDRILVVPFEAATGPFPPIAAALAARFGLDWPVPARWTEADVAAAHALVDALTARRVGRPRVTYSPDEPPERRAARAARTRRAGADLAAAEAADPRLARLLAEATALHARLLAAAPEPLRRAAAA